jgi:hypothetical protein
MRYFSGSDQKEISGVSHISTRQAQRELRLAQAWLYSKLNAIRDDVNESSPVAKDK